MANEQTPGERASADQQLAALFDSLSPEAEAELAAMMDRTDELLEASGIEGVRASFAAATILWKEGISQELQEFFVQHASLQAGRGDESRLQKGKGAKKWRRRRH